MRLSALEVRDRLADALNRVAYGGERVLIHRRGKDVAALVSIEDLQLLRELEDRQDHEASQAALAEMETGGEKGKTVEELARDLGVKL